MNFDVIPGAHLSFGFYVVVGAIGIICGALYVAFRRNRWL